jgi:hypothetical protein
VNLVLTAPTGSAPGTTTPDRPSRDTGRPIGGWAFAGVAVTSFGGPLALAALYAPSIVADASASAGLAMVARVGSYLMPDNCRGRFDLISVCR